MRPIPVVFHIGPLQIHTYGIGLAITFWVSYRYFAYRLRKWGYSDRWLGTTFVYIVIAAIVGARVVHVIANWGMYSNDLPDIFAVWHGGLSSFGGLGLAIPVGFISAHRRAPELRSLVAADIVSPVLAAGWALGRLLGPQLMVAGGGKRTSAWFGMYYADQVGRRLPVPIFQAIECTAVWLLGLALERALARRELTATGAVTGVVVGLWGLSRFFDEYFWLGHDNGTDGVEIAGLAMFVLGLIGAAIALRLKSHTPDSDQVPVSSAAP
jgi:phosphatidylglycerol---prolipoprotein diacylglyceryl transferase